MTKFRYVPIGLLLGFSVSAMSKPINCNDLQSDVEQLVCSTPELISSENLLKMAYDDALHRVNVKEKERLISEQAQWERGERSSCRDKDCLVRTYASRILTITLNKEVEVEQVNLSKLAIRFSDIEDEFLRMKIPLDIDSCDSMAEVWQPVNQQRMSSYGAICNMTGTPAKIMACNDYMVGKFHALIGYDFSTLDLANFIATYCPPGG